MERNVKRQEMERNRFKNLDSMQPWRKKKTHGLTIIEILVSTGLFTIVILGISQTVFVMHRYARANLCKMQAHLFATSLFEQLLCDRHPYDLYNVTSISLRNLTNPAGNITLKINQDQDFLRTVYVTNDLSVRLKLTVANTLPNSINGNFKSTNPPEGFQSLRLKYSWNAPTASDPSNATTWPFNELYAIRPILSDDPDYDV